MIQMQTLMIRDLWIEDTPLEIFKRCHFFTLDPNIHTNCHSLNPKVSVSAYCV